MIGTPACGVTPQLLPLRPPSQAGSPGKGQLVLGGVWSSHGNRGTEAPRTGGDRWPRGLPRSLHIFLLFPRRRKTKRLRERRAPSSTRPFVLQLKINKNNRRNPPAAAARLLHAGGSAGFAQRKGIRGL